MTPTMKPKPIMAPSIHFEKLVRANVRDGQSVATILDSCRTSGATPAMMERIEAAVADELQAMLAATDRAWPWEADPDDSGLVPMPLPDSVVAELESDSDPCDLDSYALSGDEPTVLPEVHELVADLAADGAMAGDREDLARRLRRGAEVLRDADGYLACPFMRKVDRKKETCGRCEVCRLSVELDALTDQVAGLGVRLMDRLGEAGY